MLLILLRAPCLDQMKQNWPANLNEKSYLADSVEFGDHQTPAECENHQMIQTNQSNRLNFHFNILAGPHADGHDRVARGRGQVDAHFQ